MDVKLKFVIAILAVIISLVLGAYTKVMMILNFNDPFKFWLNLILYVISWLMVFVAAFFVGKEMIKVADDYIKGKLQETYTATVNFQKKGQEEVKKFTKKGYNFTARHISNTAKKGFHTSKKIHKKTKKIHKKLLKL
ncbi:MAG: hypothetical protein WC254_01485 [Candidatus Woesearchaeota archaeon]|jgi:purine-cytosine permease-like protein